MAGLKNKFIDFFELPPEIMLELPFMILTGDQNLYIENHKGLQQYDSKKIIIKTSDKFLKLTGMKMIVEEISDKSLSISGKILEISFEDPDGGGQDD